MQFLSIHRSCLVLLALATLSGCASSPINPMRGFEQRMLFQPTVGRTPAESDFQSVRLDVNGHEQIHGLYLPHPNPKGALLYCHGNGGNIVDRLPRLRQLRSEHRLTVLGFDYRGYGQSDGQPSELNMYADARVARKWLAERAELDEGQVVLLGRSLGGGVAVELAAKDGTAGLILENTFSSISDVGKAHFKVLPVSMMVSQKFESIEKIQNYRGPLLQTHGARDEVVPFELGNRLFAECASPSKIFVTAAGGHNDAPSAEYQEQLAEFIEAVCVGNAVTTTTENSQTDSSLTCRPASGLF